MAELLVAHALIFIIQTYRVKPPAKDAHKAKSQQPTVLPALKPAIRQITALVTAALPVLLVIIVIPVI